MRFTIRQFTIFLAEISTILQMETGGSSSKAKTSSKEITHEMAMRMFGKGRK